MGKSRERWNRDPRGKRKVGYQVGRPGAANPATAPLVRPAFSCAPPGPEETTLPERPSAGTLQDEATGPER